MTDQSPQLLQAARSNETESEARERLAADYDARAELWERGGHYSLAYEDRRRASALRKGASE